MSTSLRYFYSLPFSLHDDLLGWGGEPGRGGGEEALLSGGDAGPGQLPVQAQPRPGEVLRPGQSHTRTRHMIVALYYDLVLVNNNSALALFTNI